MLFLEIGTNLALCLCLFIFYKIIRQLLGKREEVATKLTKKIDDSVKEKGLFAAQKLNMSKMGIMYRAKDYDLSPAWYIISRCCIGVIAVLVLYLLSENIILSLVGFPAGYYFLAYYYKAKNQSDNKSMLMDIYNTYANLKIQTDAGVFIFDALEYTQKNVVNPRYKEALGELVMNLSDVTKTKDESITIFENRFSFVEIEKLCALIRNMVLYGGQGDYSKDIMVELTGIISASAKETEHSIDTKVGLVTFAFFAIIIFIVGYVIVYGLSGNSGLFFTY